MSVLLCFYRMMMTPRSPWTVWRWLCSANGLFYAPHPYVARPSCTISYTYCPLALLGHRLAINPALPLSPESLPVCPGSSTRCGQNRVTALPYRAARNIWVWAACAVAVLPRGTYSRRIRQASSLQIRLNRRLSWAPLPSRPHLARPAPLRTDLLLLVACSAGLRGTLRIGDSCLLGLLIPWGHKHPVLSRPLGVSLGLIGLVVC